MSQLTRTYGLGAVDWEARVDYDRLRTTRLARIKGVLEESELGALLCFDMNNSRYITATHIGTWAIDKLTRFSLLPRNDEPIMWDFGSAARHHQIFCPWLGEERSRAGIATRSGSSWRSAASRPSLWAWISSRCRSWPPCRQRASRWSTGSSLCSALG